MMKRFGYSFWGFLGDLRLNGSGKPVDSPDGCATYAWAILQEMQARGYETWLMQADRDFDATLRTGRGNFAAFSTDKRSRAYHACHHAEGALALTTFAFPDLDILLLEWRFEVPGRDDDPSIARQRELLQHYSKTDTKIVIWDLDHKLAKHQATFNSHGITSILRNVTPPFDPDEWDQFPILPAQSFKRLVYIGSRYERDDTINRWIAPFSQRDTFTVHFHGNWMKYPELYADALARWPYICYNGRANLRDFRDIYGSAVAVPLLAKQSYRESGFVVFRIAEAALFGSVPIGLEDQKGISDYAEVVAGDSNDLSIMVDWISRDEGLRAELIVKTRNRLKDMLNVHSWVEKHLL